jgi:hypothetical protein
MLSRLSSKIAATVLALFMLTNAVVLSGELAVHALHVEDSLSLHHGEQAYDSHVHEMEEAANSTSTVESPSSLDCKDHHGCHSHSPMSASSTALLSATDAGTVWSLAPPSSIALLSDQPPVPPPTQNS